MKYFFVLLLLLGKIFSFSQDSSGIQKLAAQFHVAYYHQFNTNENFLNRLSRASMNVFNLENNVFYEEVSLWKKQNKTYSMDSIAVSIFDSVVSWFTNNHLWDHAPYALSKYKTFLTLYNERLCPCMTAKLKTPGRQLNESDLTDCVSSMNSDTAYINSLRREMQTSSMAESKFISQLSGMYVFQNCPALYEYFVDVPRDEVTASLDVRTRLFFHDAERKVVDLYNAKSFTRLTGFFPSYKSYTEEISQINDLLSKKELAAAFDKKEIAPGKTEVTKTYYNDKDKKLPIYGQVIYVFSEENVDGALLSLRFVPLAKIKNLKEVQKKVKENEELVPPEVKELEDTLKIKKQ